ncbi:hypothetical protein [Pseudomonas monteilii]|uniref:EpsG family protein n=1 Tax=Pseudomonas monteilii TaxID=76759 RepID=A0A2N1IYQ4_9PSED|nr:hypothetical protein [Pseudomonas monteilii]PKI25875.1 hypothetical protein CXB65_00060 [Pseudomonas monteilii]
MVMLALAYAFLFVVLPQDGLKDRINYIAYLENSTLLLRYNAGNGVFSLIANEPVWLLINASLQWLFGGLAIKFVVGIPAFYVSYLVLRSRPECFFWLVLFLFLPQTIKNHIIHLRQGWGVLVFLMAWFSHSKGSKLFLYALTPLIHSSFFFVDLILLLSWFFQRFRFSLSIRHFVYFVIGGGFAIGLASVAALMGARQAENFNSTELKVSGFGFVFWLSILVVFTLQGRTFLKHNSFAVGGLIVYLSGYFLTEAAGRIFESFLWLILLAGMDMGKRWRTIFSVMVLLYGIAAYWLNSSLPWFGFGVDAS